MLYRTTFLPEVNITYFYDFADNLRFSFSDGKFFDFDTGLFYDIDIFADHIVLYNKMVIKN